MGERETLAIDREIVSLTGKDRPNALFIPTASGDSPEYWRSFQEVYGQELGCETDVLYLLGVSPYDRGARTQDSLGRPGVRGWWEYPEDDETLAKAGSGQGLEGGLQGRDRPVRAETASAGCICWFSWGHSDSMSFYHPDSWQYIRVRGMGLIDTLACPHFDGGSLGVKRREDFERTVRKHSGVCVAIDDNCAIEVVDEMYRVITSRVGAGAYKLLGSGGALTTERIVQKEEYEPIAQLLEVAVQ